jgi:prevent-host-death family protein
MEAMEVSVRQAKKSLYRLLKRVAADEEIVIKKAGKPIARLVAVASERKPRFRLGSAKGEFTVPDDFNDPLPKGIEDLFY